MKNTSLITIATIATLATIGCGGSKGGLGQKNPVGSDLKTIRTEGKTTTEMGPQKPFVVTNTVVFEKPQVVTR